MIIKKTGKYDIINGNLNLLGWVVLNQIWLWEKNMMKH